MTELFFNAARKKYRYPFNGNLMTEDLFDLDGKQLDQIYRTLTKQAKAVSEDSLLESEASGDKELLDRVEIVKLVFQNGRISSRPQKYRARQRRIRPQTQVPGRSHAMSS